MTSIGKGRLGPGGSVYGVDVVHKFVDSAHETAIDSAADVCYNLGCGAVQAEARHLQCSACMAVCCCRKCQVLDWKTSHKGGLQSKDGCWSGGYGG